MPYFLSGFLKQNPEIELLLDVTNKSKVIDSLENNEVDFSLVSVLPEKLAIDKVELMQNKLFLIGNNERKFKEKSYDKSIFDQIQLIYREKGSGTRLVMERFIEKNNLPVHKKMELTSNEAVKQAVISGLGYSIMPLIGLKNELIQKEIQIIPFKNFPIKSIWHMIWMKNKKHSPVASAFLNYIKKEKENIIKNSFNWCDNY
jgi:DNA-binding transcriptional LysR family regulator